MPIANFDITGFFAKTSEFASQGRGSFTLSPDLKPGAVRSHHVLYRETNGIDRNLMDAGINLLSSGIMAKRFSIPALQLNTFEPTSFMGPTRKMPYGQQFSDLEVEFYLMGQNRTEARSLYYMFSRWIEGIAGPRPQGTPGTSGTNPSSFIPMRDNEAPVSDSTVFDIEYYSNYHATATAEIYSPNVDPPNKPIPLIQVKFSELFPINIGALQASWDSPDAPLTLSVTFAFYYARVLAPPQ